MDDMEEIVGEFLVESHENLDQLDSDLVALEQEPDSRALLGSVFRTIHTIKGTSGFLGYGQLEALTHVGENLLSKLRDGELVLTPLRTSALLELVDAVRGVLAAIEATTTEGSADHDALLGKLAALLDDDTAAALAAPAAAPTAAAPTAAAPAPAPEPVEEAPGPPAGRDRLGDVLVEAGSADPDDIALAVLEQQVDEGARPLGQILVDHGRVAPPEVAQALDTQAGRRAVADSSIRVDVDLLDSLMRLVGELVLTRNQIVQHAGGLEDTGLLRASQRLNLIASELQEGVMKTRMQPIDHVWSKLTRVVRDLGVTCGKSVRLEMEGRDTELDRTILEAVKDPLTHLVRNAVDHGIETPAARLAAGKSEQGVLLLRAFHAGGQVNIEIIDDGAGIDPHRVGAKALERGLVGADELSRMSDREIISMIFLPGFSTAQAVTNVSGRGVGMDVVKTNIENIGGSVDVTSTVGAGSTFRIKIPLTLAIIPALTVRCGGDRYAIPQVSLVELVRLEGAGGTPGKGIEYLSGAPVLRLRGNLLPLVHLGTVLGYPGAAGRAAAPHDGWPADGSRDDGSRDDGSRAAPGEVPAATFIVVLQAEDRQFGLVVDEVLDTEEIVVKPLSSQLKGLPSYAGATILGDGRVALILDALALAQQSGVVNAARSRAIAERLAELGTEAEVIEPLLVLDLDNGRRMAVPLAMVARLEEFPAAVVERVGNRQVVQYRNAILPLIDLSDYLGARESFATDGPLQVVVYTEGGRSVGLVVHRILDIVEEALTSRSDLEEHGVLGSAVVQDQITELLDVRQAILGADPHFYDVPAPGPDGRVLSGAVA